MALAQGDVGGSCTDRDRRNPEGLRIHRQISPHDPVCGAVDDDYWHDSQCSRLVPTWISFSN